MEEDEKVYFLKAIVRKAMNLKTVLESGLKREDNIYNRPSR